MQRDIIIHSAQLPPPPPSLPPLALYLVAFAAEEFKIGRRKERKQSGMKMEERKEVETYLPL
jgi:hypothetical protein